VKNSNGMCYSFSIDDAENYGLDEAVMLYNFKYWIMHNKANNKNFNDGRTWTFNSVSSFNKLFPFWSERQISRILKSLIDKGVLITGNYNKVAYDRTLWYAFKDESILPFGEMDSTETSNRTAGNVTPIPYINKDVNKNINNIKRTKFIPPTLEEVKALVKEKGYRFDPIYFFNRYTESDWRDKKGNKMVSLKGTMVTWEKNFNEYNKPTSPTNAFKEMPVAK